MAWDSAALRVEDAEDWATLAEREARERVSRVEEENAMALASAHEDAEGLALLEGELAEERRPRKLAEDNSRGLSNVVADVGGRCLRGTVGCNVRS
jgi:hypothetical protein